MDKYLNFNFNNKSSSDFNLFIENNRDLVFFSNIDYSSEFSTPLFQEKEYLIGSSGTKREFPLKCAGEIKSREEFAKIFDWLQPGTQGLFYFDYSPNWLYNVVVEAFSDASFYDTGNGLIVQFSITVRTVGGWRAMGKINAYSPVEYPVINLSVLNSDGEDARTLVEQSMPSYPYRELKLTSETLTNSEQSIANEYAVPEILYYDRSSTHKHFKLQHIGNQYLTFKYIINTTTSYLVRPEDFVFELLINDKMLYSYSLNVKQMQSRPNNITVDSEYGFVTLNNEIIEQTDIIEISKNNGIGVIETSAPIEVKVESVETDTKTSINKLYVTINSLDYFAAISQYNKFFVSISQSMDVESILYNKGTYNEGPYPATYYNWIYYDNDILDVNIDNESGLTTITFRDDYNRDAKYIDLDQDAKAFIGEYTDLYVADLKSENSTIEIFKYNNM